MLESLRKSNEKVELIPKTFGEPSTDVLVLEKLLLKEFKETFNSVILAYCPQGTMTLALYLRSMKDKVPAAIAIHPWKGHNTPNRIDKGKSVMNPPLLPQPDLMSFIIWNTKDANSAQFRRQYETVVKLHKPAMVVLLDTKMNEHNRLGVALKYNSLI